MNIELLKSLCNKYTVTVSFNGFTPFTHNVIDADLLLAEIHSVSDLKKEEFIDNINKGEYMCEEIKSIFHNIKSQGTFLISGHDALKNHSYIECKSLNWL